MSRDTPYDERTAEVSIDGWFGRRDYEVVVVGETRKKYRIRATADMRLPGRDRWLFYGEITLVPKDAVRFA